METNDPFTTHFVHKIQCNLFIYTAISHYFLGRGLHYGKGVDGVPVNPDEKMDSIQLEYTYLLTSQLESQRGYYEEKIARVETNAQIEMDSIVAQSRNFSDEVKSLKDQLELSQKDKAKSDQKLNAFHTRVTKLIHDLKEEKQMNENLLHNQSDWQKKCNEMEKKYDDKMKEKDGEITELRVRIFEKIQNMIHCYWAKSSIRSKKIEGTWKPNFTMENFIFRCLNFFLTG